jgi:sulfonate transport system permease protein
VGSLFILWFGIFEVSKVVLIAVGVFFTVYLNLVTGIRSTVRKLVEVGQVNGLGRIDMVRRILVPAALPSYVTGLRAGLALGWMFVIAAELMGASRGLGFLMLDGQMTGRPAPIVVALLLFAVAGKISDALLVAVGRRVLVWQDDFASAQAKAGS